MLACCHFSASQPASKQGRGTLNPERPPPPPRYLSDDIRETEDEPTKQQQEQKKQQLQKKQIREPESVGSTPQPA